MSRIPIKPEEFQYKCVRDILVNNNWLFKLQIKYSDKCDNINQNVTILITVSGNANDNWLHYIYVKLFSRNTFETKITIDLLPGT
jgi:hypothetical protein